MPEPDLLPEAALPLTLQPSADPDNDFPAEVEMSLVDHLEELRRREAGLTWTTPLVGSEACFATVNLVVSADGEPPPYGEGEEGYERFRRALVTSLASDVDDAKA